VTDGHGFRGNELLAPEGLVIAVCDEMSPFNRPEICADAWASTTPGSTMRLFEFNSFMSEQMSSELALVWILGGGA